MHDSIYTVKINLRMILLWIIALLLIDNKEADASVIAVYDTESVANQDCINESDFKCRIDEIQEHITSNTTVSLCSNQVVLTSRIEISKTHDISIVSYKQPVLIKCLTNASAGLEFTNITNLKLLNFTIEGCSFPAKNDPRKDLTTSLLIKESTNITVTNVNVTKGPGTGLALINNHLTVKVTDCTFKENGQNRHDVGGNGIYLQTNKNNSCAASINSTTEYIFDECRFLNNTVMANENDYGTLKGFTPINKGGGICIYICGSTGIDIKISNSIFKGNNVSLHGGGLFVTFRGLAHNNNVTVNNSKFDDNTGKYGGGLYFGFLYSAVNDTTTPYNCSLIINSTKFKNNNAHYGGGVNVFSTRMQRSDNNIIVKFENCTWKSNHGQYGSAIAILPSAWNLYTYYGYLITPVFINCTIDSNEVKLIHKKNDSKQYSRGAGSLYCSNHKLIFKKENCFTNNHGVGLYLASCIAKFGNNSVTNFINNFAYYGGAIHQLSSVIYLMKNSTLNFTGNIAQGSGGAIYQHTYDIYEFDYSHSCFIRYFYTDSKYANDSNITVIFNQNEAVTGYGHTIFASSLIPCCKRFSCKTITKDIFNGNVGTFVYHPENRKQEIVTDIRLSKMQDALDEDNSGHILLIPGKEVDIIDKTTDDLNQEIRINYLLTVSKRNTSIRTSSTIHETSGHDIILYGKSGDTTKVTLSSTSSRKIAISFEVKMQNCPPGFVLQSEKKNNLTLTSCKCSAGTANRYLGISKCNLTSVQAFRSKNYWIGYDSHRIETEDSLLSGYCPGSFCKADGAIPLPPTANRTELNTAVCSENRMGILCGKCSKNYSIHYHVSDFKCQHNKYCGLGWLFYIVSELVPVTIIFIIILSFNIPFTSGTANSFVFYSQVVVTFHITADGLIVFPKFANILLRIHTLINFTFNLDFFVLDEICYCIWKDATALDILSFSYVTVIYSFFLIVSVIFVKSKCNTRLRNSKKLQGNIIHGLSAFLILFFSHCVKNSVLILVPSYINDKGLQNQKTVAYYNGEIEWMSYKHLPYAVPAIVILVAVITPPLLLLVYPIHYKILSALKISESRCASVIFNPLEKLKPFFDSFQGCYKDEFRFFSGLYFIYRFQFLLFMAFLSREKSYFTLAIVLVLLIIIHSILQPYKKRIHNVIDVLLLGNLSLINMITMYNGLNALNTELAGNVPIFSSIQLTLMYIPLGCVLVMVCLKNCIRKKINNSDNEIYENETSGRMLYGAL